MRINVVFQLTLLHDCYIFIFLQVEMIGSEQRNKRCTIMTRSRITKVVPCNSLYPFVCSRGAGTYIDMQCNKVLCYL